MRNRATGAQYRVDENGAADFRVTRIDQIGMGWAITLYQTREAAEKVADFLNSMVGLEQGAEPISELRR